MYGAFIGDICGSVYERRGNNRKTDQPEEIDILNPPSRFPGDKGCHFTDDSVLTCAVAEAVMSSRDYQSAVYRWANRYPHAGYGGGFKQWLYSDNPQPYNSWGNGSAMRVSPIGWICKELDEVLAEAERSAVITHNHPEGVKGAQAVAASVFLARSGQSKDDIKSYVEKTFGYNLHRTLNEIRPDYHFDVSCQGSVPEAITAFLESRDFVHSIQLAISIGGDTDTIACMTGSIAEAFYRSIPESVIQFADSKLTEDMRNLAQIKIPADLSGVR
jgi:ADP-ribosylglycohydrolase